MSAVGVLILALLLAAQMLALLAYAIAGRV